jgi:excisionase family DNA binding protein
LPRQKSGRKTQPSDVLSTKEAAVICKVALSTIVYWFDKGLIRGYRTPGGHRRIFRSDLEKFLHEHSMPMGDHLEEPAYKLLLLVQEPSLVEAITKDLKTFGERVEHTFATSSMQAGLMVSSVRPHLFVVDLALPGVDGSEICRQMKDDAETRSLMVAFIRPEGATEEVGKSLLEAGATVLFNRATALEEFRKFLTERLAEPRPAA